MTVVRLDAVCDPGGSSVAVLSRDLTHGLRAGRSDQQAPKLECSRGYGSDSEPALFTSSNPHCLRQRFRAVGSTLPGKASVLRRTVAYFPSQSWLSAWLTYRTLFSAKW